MLPRQKWYENDWAGAGNDESIIEQAGTENGAKQYIAQKTGTAREQGQAADGNQAFVHEFFRFNRNAAGS